MSLYVIFIMSKHGLDSFDTFFQTVWSIHLIFIVSKHGLDGPTIPRMGTSKKTTGNFFAAWEQLQRLQQNRGLIKLLIFYRAVSVGGNIEDSKTGWLQHDSLKKGNSNTLTYRQYHTCVMLKLMCIKFFFYICEAKYSMFRW